MDVCEKKKSEDSASDLAALVEGSGDVNIWLEKAVATQTKFDWELELEQQERKAVDSGSFNRLVAVLTSYKSLDSDFMKTFITTYRYASKNEGYAITNLCECACVLVCLCVCACPIYYTKRYAAVLKRYPRSFATPWQLLEKLCQRYNVPERVPKDKALQIKLRVSVVIKYVVLLLCLFVFCVFWLFIFLFCFVLFLFLFLLIPRFM